MCLSFCGDWTVKPYIFPLGIPNTLVGKANSDTMHRRVREEDEVREFGEFAGHALRNVYLAYQGGSYIYNSIPRMTPKPSGPRTSKLRGRKGPGSSD